MANQENTISYVHLDLTITPFRHTGAVLETSDRLEKYDFGYATFLASLIGLQRGRKHHHLNIQEIQKSFITRSEYYATTILFSLPYQNLDPDVMLDGSWYSLTFNNCRHYILRLLKRLSKGREMTPEETRAYEYFAKISRNPRPHKPCACMKCTHYKGQGHTTLEIERKEISLDEIEIYEKSQYFEIVKEEEDQATILYSTSMKEPTCIP
eukprot:gene7785-8418_t